jgi:hypothetical protein
LLYNLDANGIVGAPDLDDLDVKNVSEIEGTQETSLI